MQQFAFVIDETPFCLWGDDLDEVNREFIQFINAEYFSYLSNINCKELGRDSKKLAAISSAGWFVDYQRRQHANP